MCRTLAEYMSEKVTHVVTAQEWDETFEEVTAPPGSLSPPGSPPVTPPMTP